MSESKQVLSHIYNECGIYMYNVLNFNQTVSKYAIFWNIGFLILLDSLIIMDCRCNVLFLAKVRNIKYSS